MHATCAYPPAQVRLLRWQPCAARHVCTTVRARTWMRTLRLPWLPLCPRRRLCRRLVVAGMAAEEDLPKEGEGAEAMMRPFWCATALVGRQHVKS
eukprot:6197007-Pleurochrysis_carterae.AAC.3